LSKCLSNSNSQLTNVSSYILALYCICTWHWIRRFLHELNWSELRSPRRQLSIQGQLSTVSRSVSGCRANSGAHAHILVASWQLICSPCGATSLTGRWVYHLQATVCSSRSSTCT
jgi:hypothetical protein